MVSLKRRPVTCMRQHARKMLGGSLQAGEPPSKRELLKALEKLAMWQD